QTCGIYSTTRQVAAHIDVLGYLVKARCLVPDLRIARANAGKGVPFSADKEIAVGVHIERPVCRPGWNNDWGLPGDPAVGRALELDAVAATVNSVARLILESVPRTAGLIDRKPLLVAATRQPVGLQFCPGLTAVSRPVHVLTKCLKKAEVKERACLIRVRYWVAAENIIFQYTR